MSKKLVDDARKLLVSARRRNTATARASSTAAASAMAEWEKKTWKADIDLARDLFLSVENDGAFYPRRQDIAANLRQKQSRGQYDRNLAVKAWLNLMNAYAPVYQRNTGVRPGMAEKVAAALYARDAFERGEWL